MNSTCVLSPPIPISSPSSSVSEKFLYNSEESAHISSSRMASNNNNHGSSSGSTKSELIHPALRSTFEAAAAAAKAQLLLSTTNASTNYMDSYYQSSNEIIRDSVTLLSGTGGPKRVILSVFRTTVDHFALVYPDNRRKIVALKPVGCINLRGVTCEETSLGAGLKGFTLRPKKCDTSFATLIFVCSDINMLPKWLDAMSPLPSSSLLTFSSSCGGPNNNIMRSSPLIPEISSHKRSSSSSRQSSLPSLEEEEE